MSSHIKYKKFMLNRLTVSPQFVEYIQNGLKEENYFIHTYHEIVVHNWSDGPIALFDMVSEYFTVPFIPINYVNNMEASSFFTNNINVILKIIKLDFILPFRRNLFNIDISFNDRTSVQFFDNYVSLDGIVSGIISRRFTENCELDLTNFCSDTEFKDLKICFYKLSLLLIYKDLMLRMGRDTKILNLSQNNLREIPFDILNYFIKGDIVGINLSDNNIPSISELVRITSKIEKLWLEGNPLCQNEDPILYCKVITIKFPLLKELDGIPINRHGVIYPFWRNYCVNNNHAAKVMVDKFLTLYFSHYDSLSRRNIDAFYSDNANLTISTCFTDAEEDLVPHSRMYSRNICNLSKRHLVAMNTRVYRTRDSIVRVLYAFPNSQHDPSTFNVDLIKYDESSVILVVDGVYKELKYDSKRADQCFQFRRTFIFEPYQMEDSAAYLIKNEMFSISFASKEIAENSFMHPIRNLNSFEIINPSPEDCEILCKAFQHITQLNSREVQSRLMIQNWDIQKALELFQDEVHKNNIPADRFVNQGLSDLSSDDEID